LNYNNWMMAMEVGTH